MSSSRPTAKLLAVLASLTLLVTACAAGSSSPTSTSSDSQASTPSSVAGGIQPHQDAQQQKTALQEAEENLKAQAVSQPKDLTGLSTAASVPDVLPIDNPQQPQLPVSLTDHQGTQVTVTSADRILALDIYGTLAQTVSALGLGDRLVGRVTASTETSLSHLPLVTENGHDINVEAVLALNPSLVLMDTSNGPLEVTEQLRSAGVTVVHFDPARSLDQVIPQIKAVAQALGVPESGQRLADRVQTEIDSALETIRQVAPQAPEDQLKIAFLYVRGTAGVFFILGEGTAAPALIKALGGQDVATAGGAQGTVPANAEALVKANPDLILTMSGGLESTGGPEGFFARPGVAETRAGAKQRVVDMADSQILSFGPNSAAVLLSLATAIYTQG